MTKDQPAYITKLKRLLASSEPAHIELSFQILKPIKIPASLWTTLFGLWVFHDDANTQEKAFELYDQQASAHWPRGCRSFNIYNDKDVSLLLYELSTESPLDAKDLGILALKLKKSGVKFCLENAILSATEVLSTILENEYLNLSNLKLNKLPPEIGNLANIHTLDISGNSFTTIPPELKKLSRLEYIFLDNTPLNQNSLNKLESYFPKVFAKKWFTKASNNFSANHFEEALKAVDKSLELNPEQADSWNVKGVILQRLTKVEKSLACFEQSLHLNPQSTLTYSNYAYSLHLLHKNKKSLEIAQKGITIIENNSQINQKWYATLYFRKGQALFHLKQYQKSIQAYDKALLINPNDANSWYNQACNLALYKKDKASTLKHLTKSIELNEKFKSLARKDKDFYIFWDDPEFLKIIMI